MVELQLSIIRTISNTVPTFLDKLFFFAFILLFVFGTAVGSTRANDANQSVEPETTVNVGGSSSSSSSDSDSDSDSKLSVLPGPLQDKRLTLLKKIDAAGGKGVGTRAYLSAFQSIESMVGDGESQEVIEAKLNHLESALNDQLPSEHRPAKSLLSTHKDIGIVGFKFVFTPGRPVTINAVYPDTPAAKAQLAPNDILTHVDGVSVNGLTKDEIFGMVVGVPNTKVNITIRRGNSTFIRTLTRMSLISYSKIRADIGDLYQKAL